MQFLGCLILFLVCFFEGSSFVDTDGDGLSDFQEIHKYKSDPKQADSDGDGTPDGDWDERREYTYTIRTILRVRPPVAGDHINDDYQDARIRKETDRYIELEVIHYPLNTVADALTANPDWIRDYTGMEELRPGVTTNWDYRMKRDVLKSLRRDGIHVHNLTDKEVVEKVSSWLLDLTQSYSFFNAFHFHFPDGKPVIYPGQEQSVENDKGEPDWTIQEQIEHEILGKQMYYNRSRGTCTSTAILLTTVLRAVGIPTRMIICVPLVDASDPANIELVRKGLTHHRIRQMVLDSLERLGQSNASHTFNEVFVGKHWRRLNYSRLGQNSLDPDLYGLITHTHTFSDLSEADLAPHWGAAKKNDAFKYNNSYTALHVSDLFGAHAGIPNPPAESGLSALFISRIRWLGAEDLPDCVYGGRFKHDGSGHLLLHVDEPPLGADARDYRKFYELVGKQFTLISPGQTRLKAKAERGYWINSNESCREFYVRIPPEQMEKMTRGVAYKLEPSGDNQTVRWAVSPHAEVVLPRLRDPESGMTSLTITQAYWLHSPQRPNSIAEDWRPQNDEGHLLVHVAEFLPDQLAGQYNDFFEGVDKQFFLVAEGHPEVSATLQQAWWVDHTNKVREFYIHIPAKELVKMAPGVYYSLAPQNSASDFRWKVAPDVKIVK